MTHVIFAHPHHDLAAADFAAAAVAFCGPGDCFVRVDEDVDAPKGRPDATWLGAFVRFDLEAFERVVRSIPWSFPWSVSAFVRRPGHHRFQAINLQMEFDIGRSRKLALPRGWGFDVPDQQERFLSEGFATLMDRRREMIEDSLRNPRRFFQSQDVAASFQTEAPWILECLEAPREHTWKSGRSQPPGPGEEKPRWVNIVERIVDADLAVRGVYFRLWCESPPVEPVLFERIRIAAGEVRKGDRVRIDGTVEVHYDGECYLNQVRHLSRV